MSIQVELAKHILSAVAWLHRQNIVHCDLKPDNILVHEERGGNYHVKLCDFDSAKTIGESFPCALDEVSGMNVLKFTRLWVCPEVYHFNSKLVSSSSPSSPFLAVTPQMDTFSVGLVLICLLSPENERGVKMAALPENENELLNSLKNPTYLTNRISSLGIEYHESLLSLCSLDSSSRGSLDSVLRNFQSFGLTGARTELLIQKRVNQSHNELIEGIGKKVEKLADKDDLGDLAVSILNEIHEEKQK